MKKVLFILLALSVFNCSTGDDLENQDTPEATILGRWVLAGFEQTIRVEFTEIKQFTLYSDDGIFPTLAEFNEQNPQLIGLDWNYEDGIVVVDLNFGNFSRLTPQFVCNNSAINWINEGGEVHSVYYRESLDIENCSEIQ